MDDNLKLFTTLRYDAALADLPGRPGFSDLGWNRVPSPFYMLDYHRDRLLRAATYWAWPAAVEAIAGEPGLRRLEAYLAPLARQFGPVPQRLTVTLDRAGRLDHAAGPREPTDMRNLFPGALPAPESAQQHDDDDDDGHREAAVRGPPWQVLVDGATTPASAYTHYKTTRRDVYDAARARAGLVITDAKEVLLVNATADAAGGHVVMEGSLTTPYFWRRGRWVTPPVPPAFAPGRGSGGNDGTTRRWALERWAVPPLLSYTAYIRISCFGLLAMKADIGFRNLAVEAPVLSESLVDGEDCWLSNGARGFIFGRVSLTPTGAGCGPEGRPDARPGENERGRTEAHAE